jgi:hypothetical protein
MILSNAQRPDLEAMGINMYINIRRNAILLCVILAAAVGSTSAQNDSNFKAGEVFDIGRAAKERRKGFENAPDEGPVSILKLLATPEKYHGKRVVLNGYAVLEFESHGIFACRDMAISGLNGIWIDKDFGSLPNDPRPRKFVHVIVEGVFDAEGHQGSWGGEICMITRFVIKKD